MTKIMVVEDDQSLREIYSIRLTAEGYEVVSAGDGEEALAIAVKEKPDLIVSDVMMPKISGFDMLDILRSTPETKDVKVIMMTALSSDDQRKRGESLGADKYLVKSQVGIEDVINSVREVLSGGSTTGSTQVAMPTPDQSMPAQAPVAAAPAVPASGSAPVQAPVAPNPVPVPEAQAPVAPVPVAPAPAPVQDVAAPAPQAPVAPAPVTSAPITPVTSTPLSDSVSASASPVQQVGQSAPVQAPVAPNPAPVPEAQAPVAPVPVAPAPAPVQDVAAPAPQAPVAPAPMSVPGSESALNGQPTIPQNPAQ